VDDAGAQFHSWWTHCQLAKLTAFDRAAVTKFGISVGSAATSSSSARIATQQHRKVGACVREAGGRLEWSSDRKRQAAPNGTPPDGFGQSVAVSGDTIVVAVRAPRMYS